MALSFCTSITGGLQVVCPPDPNWQRDPMCPTPRRGGIPASTSRLQERQQVPGAARRLRAALAPGTVRLAATLKAFRHPIRLLIPLVAQVPRFALKLLEIIGFHDFSDLLGLLGLVDLYA
jgi:hypothetical protein